MRYVIIFLRNFTQLQAAVKRGYCSRFVGRDLGFQQLPSPAVLLKSDKLEARVQLVVQDRIILFQISKLAEGIPLINFHYYIVKWS